MRNRSLTKEEIEYFWRMHKTSEEEEEHPLDVVSPLKNVVNFYFLLFKLHGNWIIKLQFPGVQDGKIKGHLLSLSVVTLHCLLTVSRSYTDLCIFFF